MALEEHSSNEAVAHNVSSSESDAETPDVSVASSVSTFSDLGETSIVSRREKNAAMKWSRKEKKKSKEIEKKKLKSKISKHDFCAKSLEFKSWLKECKNLSFDGMDPKKQRNYFKKFIKKWNSKKLDKKYYRGVDCLWAQGTPNTQVSWAMPGAVETTPGSLHECTIEEKYSRQRDTAKRGLGTFGKKAGAQMLRELRALENLHSETGPDKPDQLSAHDVSGGKHNLSKDWPAPPSPLSAVDSFKCAAKVDDMSPLPPPPNLERPDDPTRLNWGVSRKMQPAGQPVCMSASSSEGNIPQDQFQPNRSQTRSHQDLTLGNRSAAVPPPPPPPRKNSVCSRADVQSLRSCTLNEASIARQTAQSPRQRPVSYAGESRTCYPQLPAKPKTFKIPPPPQRTPPRPPDKVYQLVSKAYSHNSLSGDATLSIAESVVDKSVSLEHLPKRQHHDNVPNQHGPPLPKYPCLTGTHGSSNNCHPETAEFGRKRCSSDTFDRLMLPKRSTASSGEQGKHTPVSTRISYYRQSCHRF